MAQEKVGVGIIGVTPGRSWAAMAHIPALRALPEFEITALSTTRQQSANIAAEEFGVRHAFDNHHALVTCPEVDLVVVTVKVPHHFELVNAALDAGKHVYCEWPLGNGLEEAEAMSAHAKRSGVSAFAGLQARSSPIVAYVRDLVRDGYVGEVLSTSMIGSGLNWGDHFDRAHSYGADKRNGATMATIPFAHTIDGMCFCLGEFNEFTATQVSRRNSITVVETGEKLPMTAEDQIAITGILESGAVASVHYRGGVPRDGTGFLWEINGTEGDIQVTAPNGHMQLSELTLKGVRGDHHAMQTLAVPDHYFHVPRELGAMAGNVGEAYAHLLADLRYGSQRCPTFEDAVRRHRMIAAVEQAARTGVREGPAR